MSAAMRSLLAGLVALALVVSHLAYRAWPGWFGTEIYLPVSMHPVNPPSFGNVGIDFPAERLRLDVPRGASEAPAELFQLVHGAGFGIEAAAVRRMRGHDLFVQLEPDQPLSPAGPVSMRPVGLSHTPIAGVTNVAGRVTRVETDGRLWLNFGSHQLPVPPDIAGRARPLEIIREPYRLPEVKSRAADPGTFAILRVLPSGRAVLAGLIVDGRRVD